MRKYFANLNTNTKDISEFMLDIGKYKGRKDKTRLQQTVDEMKGQFVSMRMAWAKTKCSWMKFYCFTHLAKPTKSKCQFVNKLNSHEIDNIREHMKSDNVTFPLPDHKYVDQRFFCSSMKTAQYSVQYSSINHT